MIHDQACDHFSHKGRFVFYLEKNVEMEIHRAQPDNKAILFLVIDALRVSGIFTAMLYCTFLQLQCHVFSTISLCLFIL